MWGIIDSNELVFHPKIERIARANKRLARLRTGEENTMPKNNGERQKTL